MGEHEADRATADRWLVREQARWERETAQYLRRESARIRSESKRLRLESLYSRSR